jgi:methionyl-tRNA formyltransferase
LKHEIDTGDILVQEKILISENDTAGQLHDLMKEIGANLLVTTVKGIADGSLLETPQVKIINQAGELKHAPKIFTETCTINWNRTCDEIYNLIRGLSPHPGAITEFEGRILKIYRSKKEAVNHDLSLRQWVTDNKSFLKFACADGYIYVTELQLEGKKRMLVEDFLRGYRFEK